MYYIIMHYVLYIYHALCIMRFVPVQNKTLIIIISPCHTESENNHTELEKVTPSQKK